MKSVYKYPLEPGELLRLPEGSEVLSLVMQESGEVLYVRCDPETELIEYSWAWIPTGGMISDAYQYVGTLQYPNKEVYHYFIKPL